jgi:phage tail sheath protein FI
MAFQLSPGVNVSEIDLTTVVPSVATSIGALAGKFAWGPVNEIVTISDEIRLAERFGKPTSDNYEYWFTAANFLAYSNNIKVVRAANTGGTTTATTTPFSAKYPGALGNSIRVEMCDVGNYATWDANLKSLFTDAPGTSDYVASAGGANDEVHIVVIDRDAKFTGIANNVLEVYPFLSRATDAKTFDGSTNYYANVLEGRSKYVVANTTTAYANTSSNTFPAIGLIDVDLIGGADGTITDGDVQEAYDLFLNSDTVDISLVMTGPSNATVSGYVIDNIAETRKDCVVFVSPPKAAVVDNYGDELADILTYRNSTLNKNSSYAVMDSGWKYQYDKYSDGYRWIPLNGDIAGLAARTDRDRDPWYSPAGLNRGIIKNVVKLAWNPNKTDRDELYVKGINPVVSFSGEGTLLYGDKTLLSRPSAFDRINVRRLFIVLEKAIARAARSSLFEFNDQFTRAQFVALVEPFLRDVQGRRGITDFRVVCDDTNNTGEVIDRNEFIGDIYIKPARSINFIQLNFVAVRTGVSFDEIVGKFG